MVRIGENALIIPAFNAVVNVSPNKYRLILSVIPTKPARRNLGISFFFTFNFLTAKGNIRMVATPKRTNASKKIGIDSIANFINALFAPQIIDAMDNATRGKYLFNDFI